MKKVGKLFISLIVLGIVSVIFLYNLNGVQATSEQYIQYSYNDVELYNKSNTFNMNVNSENKLLHTYDMSTNNNQIVSNGAPQITVFTPGLGSSAEVWSNVQGEFTYTDDSLVTRLANQNGANVYWVKMDTEEEFNIIDINAQNVQIKAEQMFEYDDNAYFTEDENGFQRITDISKPIIILFEATNYGGYNDDVYREFNYAISRIVYDVKVLNGGVLPRLNLIGHSRGGITNMQYALDHPDLVDSMFSLGTPYLGTSMQVINYDWLGGIIGGGPGTGSDDMDDPEVYYSYMNRWNNSYNSLYKDINVHAIGSYSTLKFLRYHIVRGEHPLLTLSVKAAIWAALTLLNDYVVIQRSVDSVGFTNMIRNFCDFFGIGGAVDDLMEDITPIIQNEIGYEPRSWPHVSWYNDGLVNLTSQLGKEVVDGSTVNQYRGFIEKTKRFTIYNSDHTKRAVEALPVVHNLETRDAELLSYILKEIEVSGRTDDRFEVYAVGANQVGIRTILQDVNDTALMIPSTINGKTVVEIADSAFANNFNGNVNIKNVILPNTIKKVGSSAFENCIYLETVSFSSSGQLTELGDYCFSNCISLVSATLPSSLETLGEGAFFGCDALGTYSYNYTTVNTYGAIHCRSVKDTFSYYLNRDYSVYLKIDIECGEYYKFEAVSSGNLIFVLYDENMEVVLSQTLYFNYEQRALILQWLDTGTYYLKVEYAYDWDEGFIDINIGPNGANNVDMITSGNTKDVLEHLHDGENIFEFTTSVAGFYEVNLLTTNNYYFPAGSIIIYDLQGNIVEKFAIYGDAISKENVNNLIFYAEKWKYYYITIALDDDLDDLDLRVGLIDEVGLNANDSYYYSSSYQTSDGLKLVGFDKSGVYLFQVNPSTDEASTGNFVIYQQVGTSIVLVGRYSTSYKAEPEEFELAITAGSKYYIGYFNKSFTTGVSVAVTRVYEQIFSLVNDAVNNAAGSEVLLNGGDRGGTSMTVGYTRLCYLGSDAPNRSSRLLYNWYSLDAAVATVSEFGTITAVSPGSTVIIAVYKDNQMIVGRIEITVLADSNGEEIVYLQYGMDVRTGGTIAGTEVTSGTGSAILVGNSPVVTIHNGYTRLICLGDDSPNGSVQTFNWFMSQESGDTGTVLVSSFGTVTGRDRGWVTIWGVYKYNPRFIVYIRIQVL